MAEHRWGQAGREGTKEGGGDGGRVYRAVRDCFLLDNEGIFILYFEYQVFPPDIFPWR